MSCGGLSFFVASITEVRTCVDLVVHRNMQDAFADYHKVFRIFPSENQLGMVIAPFLPDNYGPRYLARIDRIAA